MERDQFKRLWLKGGGFIEGVRALKSQAIVALFVSWCRPLLLSFSTLLLCLLISLVVWQFWMVPNQNLAAERVTPSWKRELTQKEAHEIQNSIRQTFIQALGGVALLLSFGFTLWTLRISQRTLQTNQETLRVTQEGQITERFAQAIEHLGNTDSLMVRLGGIYALERIARDSDKDHWPIMEVLTAYVRDTAPWILKEAQPLPDGQVFEVQPPETPADASSTAEGSVSRPTPTDIQAILTVIGRRTRSPNREGEYRLDLHDTDLRSADLRGAHLEGAFLSRAHLEGAHLEGAHLEGADLREAHLEGAHLEGAHLFEAHLEGAHLREAHLEGAHLTVAQLITVCTLQGASLDRSLEEEIRSKAPHLL